MEVLEDEWASTSDHGPLIMELENRWPAWERLP